MSGRGPLVIDREGAPGARPDTAPPVPDAGFSDGGLPEATAMRGAVALAARRPSVPGRLLVWSITALAGFALSVAAWNFAAGLLARSPVLGAVAAGLVGLVGLALLLVALREVAAMSRLRRLDALRRGAEAALAGDDLKAARGVAARLDALYAGRAELAEGRARLAVRASEQFDAGAVLALAEAELLAPLDAAARAEVEAAARMVAGVTALVPLALADMAAALVANLRMIRRIAEIYGGRAGTLGAWRLARTVAGHLVATGAVAVGDDLIGSVAGGGVLAKVSRRFGEGVVNGALTARVGVAAMEVCRPLPFSALPRPRVSGLVQRALAGLFARAG